MNYVPADPIASGKPYTVVEVGAHKPSELGDFVGETTFLLTGGGDEGHRVCGVGLQDGDVVRFNEKDINGSTKDVRVWQVTRGDGAGFVAQQAATF